MLRICSFLLLLLFPLEYTSFPLTSLNFFDVELDNNSKTGYRLRNEAETGRAITLFCRNRCLKIRSQISNIVRSHNENNVNSSDDRLYFQFFPYKKPIDLIEVDEVMKKKQIGLFYHVGGKTFIYEGDYSNKISVLKWFKFFENPKVYRPEDHVELEALLNMADSCNEPDKKLIILVQDEQRCPDFHSVTNLARGLKNNPNIIVAEMKRPLTSEMEAVLKWRMPSLSDACKMTIYLNSQTYYETDSNAHPSQIHSSVVEWKADCNQTIENNRIRSKLTEIQLEYLSEERSVQKIQDNQVYVVVGAIGGIAVIALAISIFWGLQSA
ncbi:unnamed protein product [Bursaphelenchus xylophilus]|uniref:(pine wood nematode) hypothetical protein n=1 Tax=Bursaphelenchus xylophilus TaxID=6326 RepID=A0A1I7SUG2_BURXY|nr:unnamed protein product [Bursaphelenchus xylophilus]CAG9107168.1 unnamed protein product [Bursaphelenchus xylophilus]